jgi:predicted RNA-binding Zn-ribbon protein involved in translation (DUF1610 family)
MCAEPMSETLKLSAVCGLFCPGCMIYIAAHETPEYRQRVADMRGQPVEELQCEGCRSSQRYKYCDTCKIYTCAAEKGLNFCGECDQYPCAELKKFQEARPHRLELWQSQQRIREVGAEQWFTEMQVHFACPQCGTLNSAYNLSCRQCGAVPANEYNRLHKAEIETLLAQQRAAKK